jgi:hypothetical protein
VASLLSFSGSSTRPGVTGSAALSSAGGHSRALMTSNASGSPSGGFSMPLTIADLFQVANTPIDQE